jgi:hypothetical protein
MEGHMPRTVRVSAGDQVYVGGTITEINGADISADTIVLALLPLGSKPDETTTGTEPDVDESPGPSQRVVKMLVTDEVPVGPYQLWGRIIDTPEREWVRIDTVNTI